MEANDSRKRKAIRRDFLIAYSRLAALMAPVTAQTLKDTSDGLGRWWLRNRSEANIWSYKLFFITLSTLFAIVFTENLDDILTTWFPVDDIVEQKGVSDWHIFSNVLQNLLPFAYGLLGACTYLLRSSHYFARNQSFDRGRLPEYKSRMLMGLVSGGAILLFVEQIIDDGQVVNISSVALAFLAGYSTDFLFQTMERMIEAILPKVGLQSIRRARPGPQSPPAPPAPSFETLVDRLAEADNEKDKDVIRKIIDSLLPPPPPPPDEEN